MGVPFRKYVKQSDLTTNISDYSSQTFSRQTPAEQLVAEQREMAFCVHLMLRVMEEGVQLLRRWHREELEWVPLAVEMSDAGWSRWRIAKELDLNAFTVMDRILQYKKEWLSGDSVFDWLFSDEAAWLLDACDTNAQRVHAEIDKLAFDERLIGITEERATGVTRLMNAQRGNPDG